MSEPLTPPELADLVPFLTERGRLELDLALARWEATKLRQQLDAKAGD